MSEYIVEFGDRPVNDDNEFIHENIVRCRDCQYADCIGAVGIGSYKCRKHGWYMVSTEGKGFCAWGRIER